LIVDARYALRSIRSDPKIALSVFLTIVVGVASSVAMLAVVKALLLAPLPYRDASSILIFQIRDSTADSRSWRSWFDAREFNVYSTSVASLSEVMWDAQEDVRYVTSDGPERLVGGVLSRNAFDFLGIDASLGRVPAAAEAGAQSSPAFVMSQRYWMARFGADPKVVGRTFVLNDTPSVLVGVMPERFRLDGADIWRVGTDPIPTNAQDGQVYSLRARLHRSTSREEAQTQFTSVANQLAATMPNRYPKRFTVKAIAWPDAVSASLRPTLYLMCGAVGLLLLITCSNTATLLLARGLARRREFAIRTALGATRVRLVRQQIAESFVPSLLAAAAGLVLGYWTVRIAAAEIPESYLPPEATLRLDAISVTVGVVLSVLMATMCAITPVFAASDKQVMTCLRAEGQGLIGDARPRLTEAFVLMQIVLSVFLIASAITLARSYTAITSTSLGLDPSNVLSLRVQLPTSTYPSAAARQQFYRDTLDRLATTPGVVAVSTATSTPPYGGVKVDLEMIGSEPAPRTLSFVEFCTSGYFSALRLHLREGRLLNDSDVQSARQVAVVNEAFIRHYARGESVVGRTVRLKSLATVREGRLENPVFEIVGVMADAKNRGVQDAAVPAVYVPHTVTGAYGRSFLIRTSGAPASVIPILRQQVWMVDKSAVITGIRTLSDSLREFSYSEPKFTALVLGTFAAVAIILSGIGIYGLTSHAVSRRLPELSLLVALGADRWRISRSTFVPSLRVVAAGAVIGVAITAAAGRFGQVFVPALAPIDARVLALTGLIIALLTAAASTGPWRRAREIDPAAILRNT
jgi:putative ABC transport system permease protein